MTLVEVMVAATIFIVAVLGILMTYIRFFELAEISRGTFLSLQTIKSKLVDIRGAAFSQVHFTYNNTTFTVPGLNGIGVIYVDDSNAKLLRVKVTYCWRLSTGRVIGEDVNLNGVLNTGEDKNGNLQIDSPVQIITEIFG
ncbi:MAG: hypothetical protein HGA80_00780 [Candidatus Omnitrophica bacterium]|nr:hypothetical protein [Candidatus Omnitrophota bacterium]